MRTAVKKSARPVPISVKPLYGRGSGVPNPVDVHVGRRIRIRRQLLGMNQETLAQGLGLTFQQVQKYEGGANRVSASRLSAMANILGVPVAFFFGDLPSADGLETREARHLRQSLEQPETIDLIRFFYAIGDPMVRGAFLDLTKAIGEGMGSAT